MTGCLLIARVSAADIPNVTFTVTKHIDITDIEYDEAYFDEKMAEPTDRSNLYDTQCVGAWEDVPCAINYDDGPYWATTDVTVPAEQTLTVEAGTEIQFKPGVSIKGKLNANGRDGPIRLYSSCSTKYKCPRDYY